MNEIPVAELIAQKSAGMRAQWVDVRSPSEFASGHLPGTVNIPMEQIEARGDDLTPELPIVLICQKGARACIVAKLLEPCGKNLAVLAGGTDAWIKAGHPVVVSINTRWSLERQVRLGAGGLVLLGSVLAMTINSRWLVLPAFVGLGLSFAGLTGLCPMANFLGKMPWNQASHCRIAHAGTS